MHGGPFDEHHEMMRRRHAWRSRREKMEAQPSGKRWRGRVRSYLYSTARHTHEVLRPTAPVRWGSARALRLDLTEVTVPIYNLATKEDHIAPWQATYATTQIFKGDNEFVLAASGHVAGVVNPPQKNKYCYWTADKNPADPDKWLEKTTF